jgi:hypothetical protein
MSLASNIAAQRRQENMMRKIEPVYTKRVYSVTQRYYKQVIADSKNNYGAGFTRLTAKYRDDIRLILEFYAEKTIRIFGKDLIGRVKRSPIRLEQKAESYIDLIRKRYIQQHGATQVKYIVDTSRDKVVEVLANTNQQPKDMEKRIAVLLGTTLSRAATIARTETHNASQFGVNYIAKEIEADTGIKMVKAWVASQDERTRPTHAEQDADNWIGMDESFIVGDSIMMYPADPNGSAEEVINCRCALVIEEAEFV